MSPPVGTKERTRSPRMARIVGPTLPFHKQIRLPHASTKDRTKKLNHLEESREEKTEKKNKSSPLAATIRNVSNRRSRPSFLNPHQPNLGCVFSNPQTLVIFHYNEQEAGALVVPIASNAALAPLPARRLDLHHRLRSRRAEDPVAGDLAAAAGGDVPIGGGFRGSP